MKRIAAWLLSVVFVLSMAGAFAEADMTVFEELAGLEWSFSSGVGGWSTDLRILPDGSFSGEFHDSEIGESADEYPNGTVYCCSFTGQMVPAGETDEHIRILRIEELRVDESQKPESIDEGIRFVAAEPYGLSEGDEMLLYSPGTPVSDLSEEMVFWAHVLDQEASSSVLETWFLSSEKNNSGFVSYQTEETVGLANPWEEMTAEQLTEATGFTFGVPEGAENVIYRYLRKDGLAEMQFTWEKGEYCARIQPASLQEGELMNISGIYYLWEHEEPIHVGHCKGTISITQTGSEDWVELCLWYDAVPGLMYSLSVCATDVDGLDLTALDEQVYLPMQGDV